MVNWLMSWADVETSVSCLSQREESIRPVLGPAARLLGVSSDHAVPCWGPLATQPSGEGGRARHLLEARQHPGPPASVPLVTASCRVIGSCQRLSGLPWWLRQAGPGQGRCYH